MNDESRAVILGCVRHMLRPVLRFCARRSIAFPEVVEEIKKVVVEVAAEDLERRSEKVNVSRISLATGLHRKEVLRVFRGEEKSATLGYVTRVIGAWLDSPAFLTKAGSPRVLQYGGEDSEFALLVKSVCTDVPSGTVLFALESIDAIEKKAGRVKLKTSGYMPRDPEEGFKLFARDSSLLLDVVEENVFESISPKNLHVRTEFDNLSVEDLPKIREWLFREGNRFHDRVRAYLAKYDQDLHPKPGKIGGGRAFLTSFSGASAEERSLAETSAVASPTNGIESNDTLKKAS